MIALERQQFGAAQQQDPLFAAHFDETDFASMSRLRVPGEELVQCC